MQTPDKNAPIGVFDSGLGGLSAVRELRRILPHENIVYFGDTGRVPYGTRGVETIVQYAKQDIAFLRAQHVKFILAACGTVSSTLPKSVSDALEIPYCGVVASTAAAAAKASKSGRIGVIGTPATIQSGSYNKAIASLLPSAQITATSCPLFVPLVDNGSVGADNAVTTLVAQDYLTDVKRADVDTLILGCTHYPLIQPILAKIMGSKVTLIDAGREAAIAAKNALTQHNLLCDGTNSGTASYFVSDSTESFAKFSAWFLGEYAGGSVTQIDIEQYTL
ncbi:MAG: glutamate racemase [Ruthenibacterium sp.]